MGLIIKQLILEGDKGKKEIAALFDTGASASFIRRDVAKNLATIVRLPKSWRFVQGDGKNEIIIQESIMVHLTINDVTVFQQIFVANELSEELIIGADTMQHWKIRLDPENEDVIIDKKVTELKFV
ncbi:MAG: retropepsin-like aspartic protease [bacterium]